MLFSRKTAVVFNNYVQYLVPYSLKNLIMKTLFGALVVDGRNKIGGHVASKNRYGSYLRTKVTPVNPQTTRQQAVRNVLATNSQAWRGLTEPQRQGWIDAAINFPFTDIFGNTKILSGQALFVKLNGNLANVGATTISDAPSPVSLPAITALSLVADDSANTVIVTFAPEPVPADFGIEIFATPNITPGRSFVKNQFRYVSTLLPTETSPADISAAYVAMFGDPVAGQKIFIRAVFISVSTGQTGIPLQAQTIVVA